MKPTSVFILNALPIMREGLAMLINNEEDFHVCGATGDVSAASGLIELEKPDVAIADLVMESGSGISLIENLTYYHPGLPMLVFSIYDESIYAERCLRAGARGYIMNDSPYEEMLSALRKVAAGEVYISEQLSSRFISKFVSPKSGNGSSPVESLSNRELEVYELFGRGAVKSEIANLLNLSVKTVETYSENIKKKMHFRNSHELLMNAFKFVHGETIHSP